MLKLLRGELGDLVQSGAALPAHIKVADGYMNQKSGAKAHTYDGCITCNRHVWDEKDKGSICPVCGGPRYNSKHKAHEQAIHFPIKPRLEALMNDSVAFQEAVEYENHRSKPKCGVIAGLQNTFTY